MFLSGNVSRMRDIQDVDPTNIAKSLRINHSRYIQKLHDPGSFTFDQIWKFSDILDINIQLILDVIKTDLAGKHKVTKRKSGN